MNNYDFNNEYYRDLVNNMKLTMFDIIANEEARLSRVADVLNGQPEGTDISKGIELYNNQKNCITSLTLLANDFSSLFSQFDYNSAVIDNVFFDKLNKNENSVEQPQTDYNVNQDAYDVQNDVSPENVSSDTINVEVPVEEAPVVETQPEAIVETPVEEAPAVEAQPEAIVEAPVEEALAAETQPEAIVEAPVEEAPAAETQTEAIVEAPVEEAPAVEAQPEAIVDVPVEETQPVISESIIPGESLDDDVVPEKKISEEVSAPIASLTEEKVDDKTTDEKIDFVAIDPTFSRAILTTKKQTKNLRASLESKTQEFNTFVLKNKDISDEELIENGLLEPNDDIEEKIEKMMEEANNLYKDGKVEEAQSLYDKISELNKKLQESAVSK